jgi:ABC-type uncharacterized transport system substrate-binding protein
LIRDMLPSARRVTALASATDPFSKPFLEQIQLGGEATGTAINSIRISNEEEFEAAFAAMERDRNRSTLTPIYPASLSDCRIQTDLHCRKRPHSHSSSRALMFRPCHGRTSPKS